MCWTRERQHWPELHMKDKNLLHALGASSPVTKVKVHLLALQDEGPDTVLCGAVVSQL